MNKIKTGANKQPTNRFDFILCFQQKTIYFLSKNALIIHHIPMNCAWWTELHFGYEAYQLRERGILVLSLCIITTQYNISLLLACAPLFWF